MNRYATIGLSNVPGGDFDSKNISTYNATNINGHGLNRMINGDRVTYSYYLKEYRGEEVNSSKTNVLHSSSKCIGETVSRSPDGEMQRYPGKHNPQLAYAPRLLTKAHVLRWGYY